MHQESSDGLSAAAAEQGSYFINVSRFVPAIYKQSGIVRVQALDPDSALEQAWTGLSSGELVPEWIPPEEETLGVELAPGEPGPITIDIAEAFHA